MEVSAAEHGVYAGAALGEATLEIHGDLAPFFDDEDTVGKLFVGWRPLDWIAVEGGYVDLGELKQTQNFPNYSDFNVGHTGYDVFAVFLWDIAVVDLFAKAGLVSWSGDLSVNTLAGPDEQSARDKDYAWGLGAQARFGKLAVRLEYEHFETITSLGGVDPPHIVSLGVVWTF
jgi:OOP family OmpA-OmpF porin